MLLIFFSSRTELLMNTNCIYCFHLNTIFIIYFVSLLHREDFTIEESWMLVDWRDSWGAGSSSPGTVSSAPEGKVEAEAERRGICTEGLVWERAASGSHIDRERGLWGCRYLSQRDIPPNQTDPQLEEKEEGHTVYPVRAGRLVLRSHRSVKAGLTGQNSNFSQSWK